MAAKERLRSSPPLAAIGSARRERRLSPLFLTGFVASKRRRRWKETLARSRRCEALDRNRRSGALLHDRRARLRGSASETAGAGWGRDHSRWDRRRRCSVCLFRPDDKKLAPG